MTLAAKHWVYSSNVHTYVAERFIHQKFRIMEENFQFMEEKSNT